MVATIVFGRVGSAVIAAGAIAGGVMLRRACTAPTFSFCFITSPNMDHAKTLASQLVTERLAACVNIVPAVHSVYMWKGEKQEDQEVLLMCKTRTALIKEFSEYVAKNHPYEVCEVISAGITGGNPPYLKWLGEGTKEA